jgi:hypothetical protein
LLDPSSAPPASPLYYIKLAKIRDRTSCQATPLSTPPPSHFTIVFNITPLLSHPHSTPTTSTPLFRFSPNTAPHCTGGRVGSALLCVTPHLFQKVGKSPPVSPPFMGTRHSAVTNNRNFFGVPRTSLAKEISIISAVRLSLLANGLRVASPKRVTVSKLFTSIPEPAKGNTDL